MLKIKYILYKKLKLKQKLEKLNQQSQENHRKIQPDIYPTISIKRTFEDKNI